jgi:hypothetical protein
MTPSNHENYQELSSPSTHTLSPAFAVAATRRQAQGEREIIGLSSNQKIKKKDECVN